jgi:hypothetical protein
LRWLEVKAPSIINVAGPRESEAPGVYDEAKALLTHLLQLVGGSKV